MQRAALVIEPLGNRPRPLGITPGPWTMIRVAGVADAADVYLEHPTDVVVLDLGPDAGIEVLLTSMQEVLRWQPQPALVVVSEQADAELVRSAVDLGAQEMVAREEMTGESMRRVLDLAARRHLAVIRAGNREAIATARANALYAYAGAVSHDLRSPLATLISMTDMAACIARESETLGRARESGDAATMAEMTTLLATLERVELLGRRALRFTDTLLDDAESGAAARSSLDFGRLVAEAWQLVEVDGVMLSLGELPAHVFGLEAATRQVLVNLLANAIKHVPRPGGRIHVEAVEEVGSVRLRLHDNGPGVIEENRTAIFKPGVSGDGSTGRGLTTVQRQMERQGGRCWAEASAELGGAAMVLEFPSRDSSRVLATRRAMRASARLHDLTVMVAPTAARRRARVSS